MRPSTSRTLRLWISRTSETLSAAASTRSRSRLRPSRLDVHDDVDVGKPLVQGVLDPVGGGMPLPDGRAGRDADDDVGEMLSACASHPEPPQLDGRIEARDRLAGAPLSSSASGP